MLSAQQNDFISATTLLLGLVASGLISGPALAQEEPASAEVETPVAASTPAESQDSPPDAFARLQSSLDKATVLLKGKPTNSRAVLKQLKAAKSEIYCPKDLIDSRQIALIWILEGYAHLLSDNDEGVQQAWDQAFTLYDEFDFTEEEISTLQLTDDVLNAVVQRRGMVMDRGVVDLQVPVELGSAEVFSDGKKVRNGDAVYPGGHLLQIACPNDGLQSRWLNLEGRPGESVDWFGFCPSGVEFETEEAAEADSDELSLEDFGFGAAPVDPSKSYYNANPICESHAGGGNLLRWTLLGSGGAFLTVGAMSYGLWVVPAFEDIQAGRANYESITRTEADELTSAFQTAKVVTLGLLGLGSASLASGVAVDLLSTPGYASFLPSVPSFSLVSTHSVLQIPIVCTDQSWQLQ